MERLLFLSHRIPYPPDKGDKIRAWHMFRHLCATHRVHLGTLMDDPADEVHFPALRALCADFACSAISPRRQKLRALAGLRPGRPLTLDYFHDARLQAWVDRTLARGDIARVFVYCSSMAPYVMRPGAPGGVMDMVDVDSEKWTEYAARTGWPARLIWAREGRTLLRFERRAAGHFDRTLFVSAAEAARFAQLAPETADRLDWVENGVDLERFNPHAAHADPYAALPAPGGPDLVFTGTMDYWPNVDAVCWFAREVLPALRERHPGARFHVVGANPAPEVSALAALPGVHVTGRVADVRPYVAHAALAVAPLRIARGIQNKVLEAMAMGRPVVASPQAHEGVRAETGRDLLVADGVRETVRLCAEVLDGHHPGLGAAARRAMERAYAWSATLSRLDAVMAATTPDAGASAA